MSSQIWSRLCRDLCLVAKWLDVKPYSDLVNAPAVVLVKKTLLTPRWLTEHQVDVASEYLVGWNLFM